MPILFGYILPFRSVDCRLFVRLIVGDLEKYTLKFIEKAAVTDKKCQKIGHFSLENAFCCNFFVIVLA